MPEDTVATEIGRIIRLRWFAEWRHEGIFGGCIDKKMHCWCKRGLEIIGDPSRAEFDVLDVARTKLVSNTVAA